MLFYGHYLHCHPSFWCPFRKEDWIRTVSRIWRDSFYFQIRSPSSQRILGGNILEKKKKNRVSWNDHICPMCDGQSDTKTAKRIINIMGETRVCRPRGPSSILRYVCWYLLGETLSLWALPSGDPFNKHSSDDPKLSHMAPCSICCIHYREVFIFQDIEGNLKSGTKVKIKLGGKSSRQQRALVQKNNFTGIEVPLTAVLKCNRSQGHL